MNTITPTLWFDGCAEEAAERAMQAMLMMTKLDLAALEAAYEGEGSTAGA